MKNCFLDWKKIDAEPDYGDHSDYDDIDKLNHDDPVIYTDELEDIDDLKDYTDVVGTIYGENTRLCTFDKLIFKFVPAGISFTPMYQHNNFVGLRVRIIAKSK